MIILKSHHLSTADECSMVSRAVIAEPTTLLTRNHARSADAACGFLPAHLARNDRRGKARIRRAERSIDATCLFCSTAHLPLRASVSNHPKKDQDPEVTFLATTPI